MKPIEFEAFLHVGTIESVAIFRPAPGAPWGVFAHGEKLPAGTINSIELDDGSRRSWASLDAAYAFITKYGYLGKVEIDTQIARKMSATG